MKRFYSKLLETHMVDVSPKLPSLRKALAQCEVRLNPEAFLKLSQGGLAKGNGLAMAEVAGIMAAKQTSGLVPLCHQINLDFAKVSFEFCEASSLVRVFCEVQVTEKTGCEMEAIVGA